MFLKTQKIKKGEKHREETFEQRFWAAGSTSTFLINEPCLHQYVHDSQFILPSPNFSKLAGRSKKEEILHFQEI